MRLLVLSLVSGILVLGAAWAQVAPTDGGNMTPIPYGQTYKKFFYPLFQNGVRTATLSADEATGTSLNRADTKNLKIDLYENGKVGTTITSPRADLYATERKMRTNDTVLIERSDMEASAQNCDFDLGLKKYVLRKHVRVVLKNFDTNSAFNTIPGNSTPQPSPATTPTPQPQTNVPLPSSKSDSLLESPGAYSTTNTSPIAPGAPANP